MEVSALTVGARVVLEDGSIAEVVAPSPDGRCVRVRYLESPFAPALVGTEASCTDFDILAYASGTELNSAST